MQQRGEVRGDIFIDRLGGWTQVLLALASLGIVVSRFRKGVMPSDVVLAALFASEVVAGVAITPSKLGWMRFAFWLFTLRIVASLVYMGMVHGDKLERSTIGFALAGALYCWVRVRALRGQGHAT